MKSHVYWHLLRFAERLGWLGLSAVMVWLFCILFFFGSWMPTRDALDNAVSVNLPQPAQLPKAEISQTLGLKGFVAQFPHGSERSQHIQKLMSTAKALGLLVDNVSYKVEQAEGSQFNQIHIDFMIYSSYPELRAFLDDVMTEMLFISLDQLSMNRDDLNSDIVSAKVRLTLHMVN